MKDLIILGASGDLASKKLYPAIYQNFLKGFSCRYIGYGRKTFTRNQFKKLVETSTKSKDRTFLERFTYIQGNYDTKGLEALKDANLNKERIFYLSIPIKQDLLESILKGLKENSLITENTLIVLEKPFGNNLNSAKRLISLLEKYLDEKQIFLVDHYLAKNLIRNLITLRFGNRIFSDIWNNEYIEKIEILTKEKVGIENRGEFYDAMGAIKDMIQNHSLQMLSLVTMKQPEDFNYQSLSKEKTNILKNIQIYEDEYQKHVELGQYKGYLDEKYIPKDSLTETFANLTLEIDTKEWKGVPISLITGKKQDEKRTEIKIYFKGMENCIWQDHCEQVTGNILTINMYPENNITLSINSEHSPHMNLPKSIDLSFTLSEEEVLNLPYANALTDIYSNEKTYTPSYQEILYSWKFVDALEVWLKENRKDILFKY